MTVAWDVGVSAIAVVAGEVQTPIVHERGVDLCVQRITSAVFVFMFLCLCVWLRVEQYRQGNEHTIQYKNTFMYWIFLRQILPSWRFYIIEIT